MTQDDITRLAGHRLVSPWVMKLACDVANEEREKCAQICEDYDKDGKVSNIGLYLANQIRKRGEFK